MSSKRTKLDTASSENWEQKKQKPSGLPFVSNVCHLVSTKYTSIKKRRAYIRSMCTGTEKGVKTIIEVAVSSAQPILTTLEPQSATVNCKSLDSVEEKLPVLCQATDQVVSDAEHLMMSSKVISENDAVTNKIMGMVGLTKDTIQASMETPKTGVMNVKPTTFAEEPGLASAQQQQDYDSDLVVLGTMMTKFQQCAYQRSQSNVRDASQSIWDALQTGYLNKMQQVSHTTEVLQASFSTLESFQDLSRRIFSQIWEKVTEEEECTSELLEYVVCSTPLCWFVSLFNALRGKT
ncbi:perilipin-3-like isoform X2 [Emydura macquarii macquarii]|uniref:perilipin-3-like isoform X2 n=1 Tax=Emydura macquarii macquarii TaxID=1129001 RepID=UPI00352A2E6F